MIVNNPPNELNSKPGELLWATVTRLVAVALFFDGLSPLFPLMAKSTGIDSAQFQTAIGASFVLFSIGQIISVPIISKYGTTTPTGLSCLLVSFFAVIICFSEYKYIFLPVVLLMFLANSIGSAATRVALRNFNSNLSYQRIIAFSTSLAQIKSIFIPIVIMLLAAKFGWNTALMFIVAPVFCTGIWIMMLHYKARDIRLELTSDQTKTRWFIIKNKPFIVTTMIAACFNIMYGPIATRLPFALNESGFFNELQVGALISTSAAIVATSLAAVGTLSGKISNRLIIYIGCGFIYTGTSLSLLSLIHGEFYFLIAGIFMIDFAFGFIVVPCSADALNVPANDRAAASAIFGSVQPLISGASIFVSNFMNIDVHQLSVGLSFVIASCIVLMANSKKLSTGKDEATL